jgi:hypothetical protein
LTSLFGGGISSLTAPSSAASAPPEAARHADTPSVSPKPADLDALIAEAAKALADYQRLTAEGKLGEAGQKLDELKRTIEKLNARQK